MTERNWGGNHVFHAATIESPQSVAELSDLVLARHTIRPLGTRHSFNDIADTDGTLIDTSRLPGHVRIDAESATVTVGGGVRYGDLARVLHEQGWALHNLASLPHISVAGAIATATHGSGDRNGNLATQVARVRFVSGTGEEVVLSRGDDGFGGAVVAFGALGVVTEVTLDIEPTFDVRQRVFGDLPWSVALERFSDVSSAAYSVSLFTRWEEAEISLVWLKERRGEENPCTDDFFGARALTEQRHMIRGMDPRNTTEQGGVPGPWSERLAHFRFEFTPSHGEEIQSEYLVPRSQVSDAITALRAVADRIAPVLLISEIRTVQADSLWLSTAYETDVVGFHFTWRQDQTAVEAILPLVEEALFPLGARPHWGKLYLDCDGVVPGRYPRLREFDALVRRFDPEARFRNAFLRRLLG